MLLLVLVCCWILATLSQRCPVSEVLNRTEYFGYPIDVFDADYQVHFSAEPNAAFLDCKVPNVNVTLDEHHNCSVTHQVCPIGNNTKNFVTVPESLSPSLCRVYHNLMKADNTIRLVAYGGSVTVGSASEGGVRSDRKQRFPWFSYLGDWFSTSYPGRVERINLGYAAHNSYRMQDIVFEYTKKNGIKEYNSSDLIFLDFAMNDNICSIAAELHQLKTGIEAMIRKIYLMSNLLDPPAIVLLDGIASTTLRGSCAMKYIDIYKDVSRHYKLPMWSYRDAVMQTSYTTRNQIVFEPHVKWQRTESSGHPSWFVQLFTADLYASVLLKEFSKCVTSSVSTVTLSAPYELPVQLYTDSDLHCDANYRPLLSMSYDSLRDEKNTARKSNRSRSGGRGGDSEVIGSYESIPVGSWLLREDVKDKGGFIRELNYSTSEGIINNDFDARLVFKLNLSEVTVSELLSKTVHLKVEYLRTYTNAGFADVYFCGKRVLFRIAHRVSGIEALWVDHEHFKYSLPSVLIHELDFNDCLNRSDPLTLEIIHRDALNQTSVNLPAVHRNSKLGDVVTASREVRGNQKVKVMAVSICVSNK